MTEVKVPGKHTVHVGDWVDVAANPDSPSGERGWTGSKVVRFLTDATGAQCAVVTRPNTVGVRHVSVERLTRKAGQ